MSLDNKPEKQVHGDSYEVNDHLFEIQDWAKNKFAVRVGLVFDADDTASEELGIWIENEDSCVVLSKTTIEVAYRWILIEFDRKRKTLLGA